MLHVNVRVPEALNALLKELQCQVRLNGGEALADGLNEDSVVGWNT